MFTSRTPSSNWFERAASGSRVASWSAGKAAVSLDSAVASGGMGTATSPRAASDGGDNESPAEVDGGVMESDEIIKEKRGRRLFQEELL